MYCARCGTPCREEEVFCAHCGAALQVEGGRVEELSTPAAPAVETPAAEAAIPAAPHRRFSPRSPHRKGRRRLLLGVGGCAVLVILLAALAGLDRPAEGFQTRPAALLSIWSRASDGSECFYYDGELVVGPEEGLSNLTSFLDGQSCLAMDREGILAGIVTADGFLPLNRPEGTMTAHAASADGSVFYCALAGGSLWRCPLPSGEPELLAEGCSVNNMRTSPSGDAVAYFDVQTDRWYLLRENGDPEELPFPVDAMVYALSDGGRYIYYIVEASAQTGTSALCCWDGSASRLVGYGEHFSALSNRTGDQLLLLSNTMAYLVDGARNWSYPGFLYPAALFQRWGGTAGIYQWNGVGVLDCADLTQGYLIFGDDQTLYRLKEGALTPVLEDFDQALLDAAGESLWYVREGQLWQFQKGRSTLRWEDPGEDIHLEGVSPDGSTALCRSDTGLWRLKAGGTPELLSEDGQSAWAFWNGFYYDDGSQFWYTPWAGTPEAVEGLGNVSGVQYSTSSPLQVELADGSIWHVIDGKEPIQITEALYE